MQVISDVVTILPEMSFVIIYQPPDALLEGWLMRVPITGSGPMPICLSICNGGLLHPSQRDNVGLLRPWARSNGNYTARVTHYAAPRVALCRQSDAVDRRSRHHEGGIMQPEGGIMGHEGGIISVNPSSGAQ